MISLYDYENSFNKRIKLERFDARNAGKAEGKVEGKEEQAKKTAHNLYTMGLGLDKIADAVGYTVDMVKQWLGLSLAQ